jgi:hypothetical protein
MGRFAHFFLFSKSQKLFPVVLHEFGNNTVGSLIFFSFL